MRSSASRDRLRSIRTSIEPVASRSAAIDHERGHEEGGRPRRPPDARRATSSRPTSTANEPARSEAKCSAFAASAARRRAARHAEADDRARGVDHDDDDEHGERPPRHVHVVALVAARQPADRLVPDEQRHEHQERALPERRQVLGLAVPVVVLAVGRAHRDPHREEGEQRRDKVGARSAPPRR